jgi:hypothetical protein
MCPCLRPVTTENIAQRDPEIVGKHRWICSEVSEIAQQFLANAVDNCANLINVDLLTDRQTSIGWPPLQMFLQIITST